MPNKFAEAGASIAHGIGNGISFANDLMDGAEGYAGELLVKGAAGLGRGLANTIDFAGDVAAGATDMVSGGINAALGTPENASDYSSKEGFLDKANKHVQGGFDQIEDATKSKFGKTYLGEKGSDLVGFVGEMVSPMGVVGKVGKGAKIAKEYISVVKNSPKAMAELKAAMEGAAKVGKKLEQSEVDTILSKYVPGMKDAMTSTLTKGDAALAAKSTVKLLDDPKKIDLLEKIAASSPEEVATKWSKIAKLISLGKFGGKVGVADALREMSKEDIDAIEEDLSTTPAVNASVDDGITMPEADKKDMPVNKPDMSRSEEEPSTVSDKKKELELLKEKNAGDLNMATSVVDLMKGLGVDSKQEARKLIFEKMTGNTYTASAEDNIKLKSLIEEAFSKGTLPDYFPSLKR